MAETSIEWTDRVWNCIRGCSLKSTGCRSCYAMKMAHRFSGPGQPYEGLTRLGPNGPTWTGKVWTVPEKLNEPLTWRKPARIFVNSMSDLFHEDVPDEFIDRVFAVMASAYWHIFQVLTKRGDRMAAYMTAEDLYDRITAIAVDILDWGPPQKRPVSLLKKEGKPIPWNGAAVAFCKGFDTGFAWPLPNVWLGASVEDQAAADERIPHLLRTPAAVRFLSVEPMLGPIDLTPWLSPPAFPEGHYEAGPGRPVYSYHEVDDLTDSIAPVVVDWVIVGGESGPRARPCDVEWVRSVVQQCQAASVPAFVKQTGSYPVDCGGRYSGSDWPWSAPPSDTYRLERIKLRDKKGGDWSEWPADLRVREFPVAEEPAR